MIPIPLLGSQSMDLCPKLEATTRVGCTSLHPPLVLCKLGRGLTNHHSEKALAIFLEGLPWSMTNYCSPCRTVL